MEIVKYIIYKFLELAVSSLDSHLRVWNLDEGTKISEIKCNPSNILIKKY